MTAPLKTAFDVACSADHAFSVWTSRIATWWPPDHTVSGQPEQIVMQGVVGGRIFERTTDGVEHEWGEVTHWQPPSRLAYLWHLGGDRTVATEVDIRFLPQGATATRIEIEHSGWERLGPAGDVWRERNRAGWDSLLPHFNAALTKGEP
jgi:Activator of Hsp90 ATPase homolog 1-like protein